MNITIRALIYRIDGTFITPPDAERTTHHPRHIGINEKPAFHRP